MNKDKNLEYLKYGLYIFIAYLLYGILRKLNVFGGTTKEEKQLEKNNPFDTGTFKPKSPPAGKKATTLTKETAQKYGQELADYLSRYNVPEEQVLATIKKAKTKGDIFVLAGMYNFYTKSDLISDIKNAFNDDEMKALNIYVNKLPYAI